MTDKKNPDVSDEQEELNDEVVEGVEIYDGPPDFESSQTIDDGYQDEEDQDA